MVINARIGKMRELLFLDKSIAIIALVAITIIPSGCNDSTGSPQQKEMKKLRNHLENISSVESKGGSYTVVFSPHSNKIPLNQYFDLDVSVMGATKQILAYEVELEIDAGMRAHNHGLNVKPVIKKLEKAKFRVEGMLLHMPGEWFINFVIHRGTMTDKAEINLIVSP